MLRANKLPLVFDNTDKLLACRRVHAPVFRNGVVVDLYPTIYMNPNKQPGRLPWILRYPIEDDQSDEETDLRNDDPTQLPITLIPLRDRNSLVHRHNTIRQDLRKRLGDSNTHLTNAYLRPYIGEVHLYKDIVPPGAWTLTKHPHSPAQYSNTLIQIHNPAGRWMGEMPKDTNMSSTNTLGKMRWVGATRKTTRRGNHHYTFPYKIGLLLHQHKTGAHK